MADAPQKVEDREDHPCRGQRFPGQGVTAPYVGQNVSNLGWFIVQARTHCGFQYRTRPTRWLMHRRKLRTVKITLTEASVFLAKTLQPLHLAGAARPSARYALRAGAPNVGQNVSNLGWFTVQARTHCGFQYRARPTRWVVVRGESGIPRFNHGYANDLLIEIISSGFNTGATCP